MVWEALPLDVGWGNQVRVANPNQIPNNECKFLTVWRFARSAMGTTELVFARVNGGAWLKYGKGTRIRP